MGIFDMFNPFNWFAALLTPKSIDDEPQTEDIDITDNEEEEVAEAE